MSAHAARHRHEVDAQDWFAVHVSDETDTGIAGHAGCAYVNPGQPRGDALALVRPLPGGPVEQARTRPSMDAPRGTGRAPA